MTILYILVVLKVDVLEAGKMSNNNDVSEFDMGQIVIARRLGQNYLSKVVQGMTQRQVYGRPRLSDACGELRLACVNAVVSLCWF